VLAPHQSLDAVPTRVVAGVEAGDGVCGGGRERLFAEDVLAGLAAP